MSAALRLGRWKAALVDLNSGMVNLGSGLVAACAAVEACSAGRTEGYCSQVPPPLSPTLPLPCQHATCSN